MRGTKHTHSKLRTRKKQVPVVHTVIKHASLVQSVFNDVDKDTKKIIRDKARSLDKLLSKKEGSAFETVAAYKEFVESIIKLLGREALTKYFFTYRHECVQFEEKRTVKYKTYDRYAFLINLYIKEEAVQKT